MRSEAGVQWCFVFRFYSWVPKGACSQGTWGRHGGETVKVADRHAEGRIGAWTLTLPTLCFRWCVQGGILMSCAFLWIQLRIIDPEFQCLKGLQDLKNKTSLTTQRNIRLKDIGVRTSQKGVVWASLNIENSTLTFWALLLKASLHIWLGASWYLELCLSYCDFPRIYHRPSVQQRLNKGLWHKFIATKTLRPKSRWGFISIFWC